MQTVPASSATPLVPARCPACRGQSDAHVPTGSACRTCSGRRVVLSEAKCDRCGVGISLAAAGGLCRPCFWHESHLDDPEA